MTKKDVRETAIAIVIGLIASTVVVFIVTSGFRFLSNQAKSDAQGRHKRCAELAKLTGATDYEEKNYTCYLSIENKIKAIQL